MQNLLRILRLSFSRFRHGKGFGIHSPFAYRFITEVLRQPYAYYSYGELKDRPSRLAVRLTAYFKPKRVYVHGTSLEEAVRKISPKVIFTDMNPDFIITDAEGLSDADMAARICRGDAHVLVVGRGACKAMRQLKPQLKRGMSFSNGRNRVVLAAFKHLPRQDFQVRF